MPKHADAPAPSLSINPEVLAFMMARASPRRSRRTPLATTRRACLSKWTFAAEQDDAPPEGVTVRIIVATAVVYKINVDLRIFLVGVGWVGREQVLGRHGHCADLDLDVEIVGRAAEVSSCCPLAGQTPLS